MLTEIMNSYSWLENPIPLWAFIVALLTSPAKWSRYAQKAIESRLGDGEDSNA